MPGTPRMSPIKAEDFNSENMSDIVSLPEVVRGLSATVQLVQDLHREVKEFAINQATLRASLTSIEITMRELRETLSTANPTSIAIRLVVLEQEFSHMREWREERIREIQATKVESARQSWQLRMSIVTSIVSFTSSLVLSFLSWFLKH